MRRTPCLRFHSVFRFRNSASFSLCWSGVNPGLSGFRRARFGPVRGENIENSRKREAVTRRSSVSAFFRMYAHMKVVVRNQATLSRLVGEQSCCLASMPMTRFFPPNICFLICVFTTPLPDVSYERTNDKPLCWLPTSC